MRLNVAPKKTLLSTAIASFLVTGNAVSGSFSLYTESSPAAIGNYAAGIAASAQDASTGWYNPAGLVLLPSAQAVIGGVGIFPRSKLTGTSTYQSQVVPGTYTSYQQNFDGLQGAENAFVPSAHLALPLTPDVAFGLSLLSPFGLTTSWGENSPVRYQATDSKLTTVDIAPELAARVWDNFSVGLGIDLEYARVTFDSVLGSPALLSLTPFSPTTYDSSSKNKGNSFGVGFHAGAMLLLQEGHTRFGVNYQSEVSQKFHGSSRLRGRLAAPLPLSPLSDPNSEYWVHSLSSNTIDLPQIVTLSGYHDVNDCLALLGSVVYTGWHSLSDIQLNQIAATSPLTGPIQAVSTSILDYRDAWRFAVGANYKLNPQWMLRVGGGYDETPTRNSHRDVRIPDSNRWALAAGAHFQANGNAGVDVGYSHLFADGQARINNTQVIGTSTFNVDARAKNSVDLVGVQLNWTMDDVQPIPTK